MSAWKHDLYEPEGHEGIAACRVCRAAPELLVRCIKRVESCLCGMPKPSAYADLYECANALCVLCREDLAAIAKDEGRS